MAAKKNRAASTRCTSQCAFLSAVALWPQGLRQCLQLGFQQSVQIFYFIRFFWPCNNHLYSWHMKVSPTVSSVMWLQCSLCNLLINSELFVELVHWCTPGLVNSLVSTALEEHTVSMLLRVLCTLHSDSCGRKRDWSIFSPSKNWRWVTELLIRQRCTCTVPSLA